MPTHATIGTVSHGTLRTDDLLDSFLDLLEDLMEERSLSDDRDPAAHGAYDDWRSSLDRRRGRADYPGTSESDEDLAETMDRLEEFAPPYCYFGTLPGDGSDFGFWPSEDLAQLVTEGGGLVVSDLSEVPEDFLGEVFHVNDHGNATLYAINGPEDFNEVWSIV